VSWRSTRPGAVSPVTSKVTLYWEMPMAPRIRHLAGGPASGRRRQQAEPRACRSRSRCPLPVRHPCQCIVDRRLLSAEVMLQRDRLAVADLVAAAIARQVCEAVLNR
jgi:hypothetical protein